MTLILFLTILFANFAESVAEGRGKAQAESLKKTQKNMKARIINKDKATNQIKETIIDAIELKKDDIVLVKAGELIPSDGEGIEGIASVDESAITGESAPVVKESGGDFASVTGGTTVSSDWLKIKITSSSGESFLDKMISSFNEVKTAFSVNSSKETPFTGRNFAAILLPNVIVPVLTKIIVSNI